MSKQQEKSRDSGPILWLLGLIIGALLSQPDSKARSISQEESQLMAERAYSQELYQRLSTVELSLEKQAAFHYEKGQTYNQIIIGLGYLALFSIWDKMDKFYTHEEKLLVAACITFSVFIFILWVIYQMISHAVQVRGLVDAAKLMGQGETEAYRQYEMKQARFAHFHNGLWIVVLALTIGPAALAVLININRFINDLFHTNFGF